MEVLEQITKIINWYIGLKSDSVDINGIMHKRKQLAGYNVNFATEVGRARRAWKTKEAEYESAKNQKRVKYLKEGTTKADYMARANTEFELAEMKEAESLFFELNYVHTAVKDVLAEMNQRISRLRDEEKQERFYNK